MKAPQKKKQVRHPEAIPVYIILTLFSLLSIMPIYFSLITSFKTNVEYIDAPLSIPKRLDTTNYVSVMINGGLMKFLGNNIILLVGGTALYLIVCSAAGFAFGKLNFKGRLPIFLGVLFLMIFPQMVVSSQVYRICVSLKLMNTFIGVMLVWVAYFAPFGTYIMTTYFASVPKDIVESAHMDGANVFQILALVMIPIAAPMIATIAIIGFLSMWNELPFSLLLLQKPDMRTITLGIAMLKGEHGLPVPRLSAALVFSACIPLCIFLFFQKYVAMGATAGAVKG